MDFFTEYFSWDFTREPEGYMSWQHLTMVTAAFTISILCAIFFSKKFRNRDRRDKIRVLKIAALLLDGFELLKLTMYCIMEKSFLSLTGNLPLFLCSIPLIVLPIAAFSKGRLQQSAIDFVMMFGLLGGVLGTYMAGNIYGTYPVIHFHPLVSLTTHMISAFSAMYIGGSRLFTLEKKNIKIEITILGLFMATAYAVNMFHHGRGLQDNYMFLSRSDGTPFLILEGIFGGDTVPYALSVAFCMWAYMGIFYLVAHLIRNRKAKKVAEV